MGNYTLYFSVLKAVLQQDEEKHGCKLLKLIVMRINVATIFSEFDFLKATSSPHKS
jgi:hypothetical protein